MWKENALEIKKLENWKKKQKKKKRMMLIKNDAAVRTE